MNPLNIRVEKSLRRLGLGSLRVTDLGDGVVQLTGELTSEDASAVLAAVRSVVGVKSVVFAAD